MISADGVESRFSNVGYVVPTLGKRIDYLKECLNSLHTNRVGFVVLVRPDAASWIDAEIAEYVDLVIDDGGSGLAAAINKGFRNLPSDVTYLNWIGDDDFLAPKSISYALQGFKINRDAVAIFGRCSYIDGTSQRIWENKSGQYATTLMKFGPFLIPQPGSLIRSEALNSVGLLDEKLQMAFDLDLFLRLDRFGSIKYLNRNLASYRWHDSTLTSKNPKLSLKEGKSVKLRNGNNAVRTLIYLFNRITICVVYAAKKYIEVKRRYKFRFRN